MSCRIIGRVVAELGQTPVYCSNGQRAWEVLLDNPQTKLLITDISMPEKDGRELVTAVRSHADLKQIPVIIVSGVVSLREIGDLLELGASRFLPKPVDVAVLRDYINYYCK